MTAFERYLRQSLDCDGEFTDRFAVRAVFSVVDLAASMDDMGPLQDLIRCIQGDDFVKYPAAVTVCLTFTRGVASLVECRQALAWRLLSVFDAYGGKTQLDFLVTG